MSKKTYLIGWSIISFMMLNLSVINGQSIHAIDGYGNNPVHPEWGAVGDVQPRLGPVDFEDGISIPKTSSRPNPRLVSNLIFAQKENLSNSRQLSDFTWAFGQFVDHDIVRNDVGSEVMDNIVIPEDDDFFAPGSTMYMYRSQPIESSGTSVDNPLQYANKITAYLDLSNIYGSDEKRANWLRTFKDGKLKVSEGNLLPWNTVSGEFNDDIDPDAPWMADDTHTLSRFYVSGDVRANENPLLLAYHTLFVREHNRLCDEVKKKHPGWNDKRIYDEARKWNIAYYQRIIYYEWLPFMGVELPEYNSFKEEINPQIWNEFSTAAFRMGHTLVNDIIIRMDNDGQEISGGSVSLKDAFFNPYLIEFAGGIDPYFTGMATQVQQAFDLKVVDAVRNFLFGAPGEGGLDLAAININRGRDRGIADYNSLRWALGLPPVDSFDDITQDIEIQNQLKLLYGDVNNIDAWVGMLAEDHLPGTIFGKVVSTMMIRQFQSLREGDRFYFENVDFTDEEKQRIIQTNMRDIIMRNTDISLMQENVFMAMPHENIEPGPELIPFPLEAAIFPNPVLDKIQIKVYASRDEDMTVSVIDYMGRMVSKTMHQLKKGNNIVVIAAQTCPRGYYNVVLDTDHRRNVLKMVKK